MSLLDLLRSDGSIVVNKKLARAIGIDAAIMYSEIISKQFYFETREQMTDDGFFFNTIENMEEDTSLSKYQQTKAIKKLVELKLIFHQNRGLPQKRYFKVNPDERHIMKTLDIGQKLKNSPIRSENNKQLKGEKVFGNNTKSNNTKSNNNKNIYIISQNDGVLFSYYIERYKEYFGKEHPTMNEDKMGYLKQQHDSLAIELDIDEEKWIDLVDYHFEYLSPKNNGNILSFLIDGVIYRYLEEIE